MDELRADLDELETLLKSVTRPKVKNILQLEVKKIQTEIINRLEREKKTEESVDKPNVMRPVTRYSKVINTYAWDQTTKFMKIYVTLDGVQNVDKNDITSEFTVRSFHLTVSDLNGVDYKVGVAKLFEDVIPEECYHKVKTDRILLMLKKREEATWAYVTEQEKKSMEKAKPKVDESKDPNESLMDMLKNMYEGGDDEMKRTIAKAWTQSRDKNPDS